MSLALPYEIGLTVRAPQEMDWAEVMGGDIYQRSILNLSAVVTRSTLSKKQASKNKKSKSLFKVEISLLTILSW